MNSANFMKVVTLSSTLLVAGCSVGDGVSAGHYGSASLDVAPVANQHYIEECGDCHMAYQPGLLPQRSWQQMMMGLEDHFGDNAELDSDLQQQLTDYLVSNAADNSDYKRSKGITRSLSVDEVPLRISETRYFLRKHDELPDKVVQQNPEVKSFSRCEVCHAEADKGSYNEHQVRIPGYGQWID